MSEIQDGADNRRPIVNNKSDNQGCSNALLLALKVILVLIALQILIPVFAFGGALLLGLFGVGIGAAALTPLMGFDLFGGSTAWMVVMVISLSVAVLLPIVAIIYWIILYARTNRGPSSRFWIIAAVIWLIAVGGICASAVRAVSSSDVMQTIQGLTGTLDPDQQETLDDGTPVTVDHRTLDDFSEVSVIGAAEVIFSQGATQAVTIKSNYPDSVLTSVENGLLTISLLEPKYTKATIEITLPTLCAIHGTGACNIEMNDSFTMDSLLVDMAGASTVELKGTVNDAQITLTGASHLNADDLVAQDMHLNCTGASVADIHVVRNLWAQALGASAITYEGTPAICQHHALGASTIQSKD